MQADITPTVSVVITTYQAENFIARALRSAIALKGPWELEIIVFDDGSTDGTVAVARNSAEEDTRIRIIEGGRCGRAVALNKAIDASRGDYVAILDADDIALPERLEWTVPVLRDDPTLGMVAAGAHIFSGEMPPTSMTDDGTGAVTRITPGMLYASNRILHSTVLFRRTAWEAAGGYDEKLDICIDYSFYFRLLRAGGIAYLDRVTCLRHWRRNSYFATKSRSSYIDTLSRVRSEARHDMPIPILARIGAAARTARYMMHDVLRRRGRREKEA